MGTGTGTGTGVEARGRTQDGNRDGSGDRDERSSGDETGTRIRTGTGMRAGSGMTEERRRSTINHPKIINAIRHFYSARVTIPKTGGGTCGHPKDSFARPSACTHASHRGGNRVRGTGRTERGRGRGWDRSRGREWR